MYIQVINKAGMDSALDSVINAWPKQNAYAEPRPRLLLVVAYPYGCLLASIAGARGKTGVYLHSLSSIHILYSLKSQDTYYLVRR